MTLLSTRTPTAIRAARPGSVALRDDAPLNLDRWYRYLAEFGPQDIPMTFLGVTPSGFPAGLNLDNPPGPLCLTGSGLGALVEALIACFVAYGHRQPWETRIMAVTDHPDKWRLLQLRKFMGMRFPLLGGVPPTYRPARKAYTLLFVDGLTHLQDGRMQAVLQGGQSRGIWPFVLTSTVPVGWPGPVIVGSGAGRYDADGLAWLGESAFYLPVGSAAIPGVQLPPNPLGLPSAPPYGEWWVLEDATPDIKLLSPHGDVPLYVNSQ